VDIVDPHSYFFMSEVPATALRGEERSRAELARIKVSRARLLAELLREQFLL
jgi:hypothetical protein